MRTARSSSRLMGGGGCLPQCMLGYPHVGLETYPPGVGLETPLQARPLNFPPGCGPGDPPQVRPLNFPPGCGPGDLQCMLGYQPPTPCEQNHRHLLKHSLPTTSFAGGNNDHLCFMPLYWKDTSVFRPHNWYDSFLLFVCIKINTVSIVMQTAAQRNMGPTFLD